MSKRKEYRVGEIFRHNGETYKCVRDLNEFGCEICEMPPKICDEDFLLCSDCNRTDKTNIHFVRVTEPEEGMLFRASDGVLYELKKLEYRGRGCYLYGYMSCSEIDEEAFGEMIQEQELHWLPVEEKKEDEKEMIDYSKIDLQKVYMRRHLELAVVAVENGIVAFKVADQFYDESEFCDQYNKSEFKAKNLVTICLGEKLKWDKDNKILYLRRLHDVIKVDETIKCSVHHFADTMEAVNEYNETNGKGYEKQWPQKGDKYFCIHTTGCMNEYTYDNDYMDKAHREFGNFFRTREEAEATLERVKKALKGE